MIAAAYVIGLGTGMAVALTYHLRQQRKGNRDALAVRRHLAMVRAMNALSSPDRSTPQ